MNPLTDRPGKTGAREMAVVAYAVTVAFGVAAVTLAEDHGAAAMSVFTLFLPVTAAWVVAAYYSKQQKRLIEIQKGNQHEAGE